MQVVPKATAKHLSSSYSTYENQHSVCLCCNIQGMNPCITSKSSWKLPHLKQEIELLTDKDFFVPFIALTETWLKPVINDSILNMNNYNIFRADRNKRLNGGVLLYTHQNITIDVFENFNDEVCSLFRHSLP